MKLFHWPRIMHFVIIKMRDNKFLTCGILLHVLTLQSLPNFFCSRHIIVDVKTYTTCRETNRKYTLFCHLIKFPPSKRYNFTILVANSLSVAMDADFYKRNIAFRLLENCNKNLDKSAPRRVRIPLS